jgi:hypothetical protein
MQLVIFTLLFCSSAECFVVLLLMRQRFERFVAAGSGLNTGLGTTIKYVQRTASGVAGNGLGTTAKYQRRSRNGAAGRSFCTTAKYL